MSAYWITRCHINDQEIYENRPFLTVLEVKTLPDPPLEPQGSPGGSPEAPGRVPEASGPQEGAEHQRSRETPVRWTPWALQVGGQNSYFSGFWRFFCPLIFRVWFGKASGSIVHGFWTIF